MAWQDDVIAALATPGTHTIPVYDPETGGHPVASDVAGEIAALAAISPPGINILAGVSSYAIDPETGEPTSEPAWRMLAVSGPAQAIFGIGGQRLSEWADTAVRRSRILMLIQAITLKVYPAPA